jgi:hypothetical protein
MWGLFIFPCCFVLVEWSNRAFHCSLKIVAIGVEKLNFCDVEFRCDLDEKKAPTCGWLLQKPSMEGLL